MRFWQAWREDGPASRANVSIVSPGAFCLLAVPGISFDAQEIVQKPGYVIMLNDEGYRVIPTDGRPAISQNAKFWFGNSRGRWEGDTLVVEVTSLNGRAWFDSTGQFYSENTRMVERWKLVDARHRSRSSSTRQQQRLSPRAVRAPLGPGHAP